MNRRNCKFVILSALVAIAFAHTAVHSSVGDASLTSDSRSPVRGLGKTPVDEFAYLEETNGARAQAWVKTENDRALAELQGDPRFQRFYKMALDSEKSLSPVGGKGLLSQPKRMWLDRGWVYQLWVDVTHSRGIWRRASLQSFVDRKPDWQTLLDIDALSAAEDQDWTFIRGYISPNGRRFLLQLSLGGSVRTAWREFDIERRAFVTDGFHLPPTIGEVVWRNDDTVITTTDLEANNVTRTGQSIVAKEWSRGQSLSQAKVIFRGQHDDIKVYVSTLDSLGGGVDEGKNGTRVIHIARNDSTNNLHWWRLDQDHRLEQLTAAPLLRTAPFLYKDQYIIILKEDWRAGEKTWTKGTAVAIPASDITRADRRIYSVLAPEKDTSVLIVSAKTPSGVLLLGTRLGHSRLWRSRFENGSWVTDPVALPDNGVILPEAADIHSNTTFVRHESFLNPPSLYRVDTAENEVTLVASGDKQFESSAFVVEQLEAKSADGTLVPYSLVRSRTLPFNGQAPALVVGYGASGVTYIPSYSGTLGKLWLEQGGVYALAGVRGGQERGRDWMVRGVGRQHTYEDTIAVTEDLIRRNITASKRVGFMGHSNGGLLGGVMLTQRPDLFGAVVLKAPLLDQFRLDLVTQGPAGWAREFGSPDVPRERAFLERTSPFQNLKKGAELPRPFLITSTTDETVLPGQARRFAAKMDFFNMPFLFYETVDGGHGLSATPIQRARLEALIYTYLTRQLFNQPAGS